MKTLMDIQKVLYPLLKEDVNQNDINLQKTNDQFQVIVSKDCLSIPFEEALAILKSVDYLNVINESTTDTQLVITFEYEIFENTTCELFNNKEFFTDYSANGEVVTIDMSSPNIAKPMSYQHLRSTIIGNVVANALMRKGYETIKINHLGDWGVPLASIILAVQKWGNIQAIEDNPMIELDELYRVYLTNLQLNPYLEEETLQTYKELNFKEGEVYEIWEWLKTLSMNHFNDIYEKLNIEFDSIKGESFYNNYNSKMIDIIDDNSQSSYKHDSLYLTVDDQDIVIQDGDGYSTYLTRDLAAAYYRYNHYQFDKALYIIGKEQTEHFSKLKNILNQLGFDWSKDINHIGYSPVMTENDNRMNPNKQDALILNVISKLTEIAARDYNIDIENAEVMAVNSLVFEFLDNYRDEILTINIDRLEEILENNAFEISKLTNQLESKLRNISIKDEIQCECSSIYQEMIWNLSEYPSAINTFLNNYDSIILTKYMRKLLEITHNYINSFDLHDRMVLSKEDYNVLKTAITVLDDCYELMGLNKINHI